MRVIDSHTEGEPTRTIVEGGPVLKSHTLADQAVELSKNHQGFLNATLTEPRGFDAMVGALLRPAIDAKCETGVIYYTAAGALGMCGHGTIGLVVTLAHMGRISVGIHYIETPVGVVRAELKKGNEVSIQNVESYRYKKDVSLNVDGLGVVTGDIAWGGNWFFLTKDMPCELIFDNIPQLLVAAKALNSALNAQGITGKNGAEIDHFEFNGLGGENSNGRNFVLCPNGTYDRSPCGTGTSAKLACLAADGDLQEGEEWIQESITGSCYYASFQNGVDGGIVPTITGKAFVTGETILVQHPDDPYINGIVSGLNTASAPK